MNAPYKTMRIILIRFIAITYGTICIVYAVLMLTAETESSIPIRIHCPMLFLNGGRPSQHPADEVHSAGVR
jgi:hypothetical protein